jgi:hypothetical protein
MIKIQIKAETWTTRYCGRLCGAVMSNLPIYNPQRIYCSGFLFCCCCCFHWLLNEKGILFFRAYRNSNNKFPHRVGPISHLYSLPNQVWACRSGFVSHLVLALGTGTPHFCRVLLRTIFLVQASASPWSFTWKKGVMENSLGRVSKCLHPIHQGSTHTVYLTHKGTASLEVRISTDRHTDRGKGFRGNLQPTTMLLFCHRDQLHLVGRI